MNDLLLVCSRLLITRELDKAFSENCYVIYSCNLKVFTFFRIYSSSDLKVCGPNDAASYKQSIIKVLHKKPSR